MKHASQQRGYGMANIWSEKEQNCISARTGWSDLPLIRDTKVLKISYRDFITEGSLLMLSSA
jgi:hypothetical protein